MKIHVCVPTHERVEALTRLVGDLEREGAARVSIYDDCSRSRHDYSHIAARASVNGWRWRRTDKVHGKSGYPRLIHRMWQDLAGEPPADLYVFLEDDLRLCFRFFEKLVAVWESLEAASKATILLTTDTRDMIWDSSFSPRPLGMADQIDWVDTRFAAPRETLLALNFTFPYASAVATATGSGSGEALTRALRAKDRTMYRANPSLVAHVSLPSVMHAKEREKNALHAKYFIDGEARHVELLNGRP